MKRKYAMRGLFAAVLLAASASSLSAQSGDDYIVIVNPDNPASRLSQEQLSDIFLRRITQWEHGRTIEPVDQTESAPVRFAFSRAVLQRRPSAVKAYWLRRIYSGRETPPPEMSSDNAVVAYVRSNPGAIGYVSRGAGVRSVKVVSVSR